MSDFDACFISKALIRGTAPAQLTNEGHKLWTKLRVAFTTLNLLAGEHALPFPGTLELGDHHRFVELRDRVTAAGEQGGPKRLAA